MVDNQHRKISGYRDLSEEEIAAMNKWKALEREVLQALNDPPPHTDPRWLAIGRTHIEQGFMAAIRAIAKPNSD